MGDASFAGAAGLTVAVAQDVNDPFGLNMLVGNSQRERFPPEAVSPPIVYLCTDEAKDISGRQFLVGGNSVSLLSWQVTPIAKRDLSEGVYGVAEIGELIQESKDAWPPINPLR